VGCFGGLGLGRASELTIHDLSFLAMFVIELIVSF
jgi:hypothetical protein